MRIEHCDRLDHPGWLELRLALWPDSSRDEHVAEMAGFLREPQRYAQFVAAEGGRPIGFVEVSLRHDYVLGTDGPPPIGFLEGLYVVPASRRQGCARRLVELAIEWARAKGCREFASDALLANTDSHAMHRALGFEETERVVCFRRLLQPR